MDDTIPGSDNNDLFDALEPGKNRKRIRLICLVLTVIILALYFFNYNNYKNDKEIEKGIMFTVVGAFFILVLSDIRHPLYFIVLKGGRAEDTSDLTLMVVVLLLTLGILSFIYGVYLLISSGFLYALSI